jgi:branched-chain amino acid transport system permease protein
MTIIAISMVISGLLLGSIFALVSTGTTIIYGSVYLPNAASGQMFLLAALGSWSLCTLLGIPLLLAIVVTLVASVPLSYLLEATLIRRFYDVPDRHVAYFIVTLGLGQILYGIFNVTFGRLDDHFSFPPLVGGFTRIGPFPLSNTRLVVLIVALATLAAVFVAMRFHPYGRALRAVFQAREAAALRGVDVRGVYRLSIVLGTALIFLSGILYALAYGFDLTLAWGIAITAFAIMITGGPGSVLGAVVIGMLFGFTQAAVSVFASPTAASFCYLGVMLVAMMLKPSGVFTR